jgi:hypothetical protein
VKGGIKIKISCESWVFNQDHFCDSPNLLEISVDTIVLFGHFGRVTALLATYDLLLVSEHNKTAFS